jgi:hypothetical protein
MLAALATHHNTAPAQAARMARITVICSIMCALLLVLQLLEA